MLRSQATAEGEQRQEEEHNEVREIVAILLGIQSMHQHQRVDRQEEAYRDRSFSVLERREELQGMVLPMASLVALLVPLLRTIAELDNRILQQVEEE